MEVKVETGLAKLPFGTQEWESRLSKAGYAELDQEDQEVFSTISETVADGEREAHAYSVYLTLPLYQKIEYCFKRRMSVRAMCGYVGITQRKWDKLTRKYTKLPDMVEMWKGYPEAKASENIANAVLDGDLDTSKWAAERWDKEGYGKTVGVTVDGEVTVTHEIDYKLALQIREKLLAGANSSENEEKFRRAQEAEVIDVGEESNGE